jgi:hypothetical protein
MKNLEFNQVRIIVSCQYYENYAADNQDFFDKPIWKTKGESQFTFVIDSDEWTYGDDNIKRLVEKIILNKSNSYCKYKILGYETYFVQPDDITDEVKKAMQNPELSYEEWLQKTKEGQENSLV